MIYVKCVTYVEFLNLLIILNLKNIEGAQAKPFYILNLNKNKNISNNI